MSTRGCYEYYVVDEGRKEITLALQFYKWGDAVPEFAIEELLELRRLRSALEVIPVQHMRALLKNNLGAAFPQLFPALPLAAYFFLLQRAAEDEHSFWFQRRYRELPQEERPDHQVGLAVGKAKGASRHRLPASKDPVVRRAHSSISVGTFLRRWSDCSKGMNFLRWLHFITMLTEELHMGCIAGDYQAPFDISFCYRVFFHVPELAMADQVVSRIEMELCSDRGRSILSRGDDTLDKTERRELKEQIQRTGFEQASLAKLLVTHAWVPCLLWTGSLPRQGEPGS